jgi:hypothetical protein
VTFSGAASLGGNIAADVLNQEYNITEIVDADSYKIEARTAGTSISDITVDGQLDPTLVVANSSDSGDGGASVVGAYQINVGLDTSVFGPGWGAGTWGREGWGDPAVIDLIKDTLRIWEHDNFGEDLLINVMNGGIYYWDKTNGLGARAVALSDLAGASGAPTIAKNILVSDVDRHVIAFGCDPEGNPGVQDPLTIRFSDQENVANWQTTATTTAGELRLGTGSTIVGAVQTKQQIVVFTDSSVHALQFIGPPYTFGVQEVSSAVSIMGPNSMVSVGDLVFWMGKNEFYVYDGAVMQIPCSVKEYVFSDINVGQQLKVYAGPCSSFSEV